MMKGCHKLVGLTGVAGLAAMVGFAQFGPGARNGSYVRIEGGLVVNEDTLRTARETDTHSIGTPDWEIPAGFEHDTFTFCRVIFQSDPGQGSGRGWGRRLGWWVDYPDADLNFSHRLHHLTAIRADPDGRVLKLTHPDLFDHPLIYLEHAGYMILSEPEVQALQHYFARGGAMLVNDFWSTREWEGFASEMDRVLPGRRWVELTMEHPLFHSVYDLEGPMNRLQVPTIQFWNPDHDPKNPDSHLQRVDRGAGSGDMHVRAWLDDKGRIMILVIHNSDISDGWEREGENDLYFELFSDDIAYPLGINFLFHLMTH